MNNIAPIGALFFSMCHHLSKEVTFAFSLNGVTNATVSELWGITVSLDRAYYFSCDPNESNTHKLYTQEIQAKKYIILCAEIWYLVLRYNLGSVRNIFGSVTAWPEKAVLGTCHRQDQPKPPYPSCHILSDERSWCYMYLSSCCSLTIKDHGLNIHCFSPFIFWDSRSHTKS